MSKKTAYMLIVVLFVLLAGGLLYFYLSTRGAAPAGGAPETGGNPIFPSGGGGAGTRETPSGTGEETPPGELPAAPAKLRRLTDTPIAGAALLAGAGGPAVRYIERGTGHVFEIGAGENAARRLSNTTIPKIYEALFSKDGTRIIARYLKEGTEEIVTFSAELAKKDSNPDELALQGAFLPANISAIARAPGSTRVFYVTGGESGARGFVAADDGSQRTEIWSSPLREWSAAWPREDTAALWGKPAAAAPGYLLFVDMRTGRVDKIVSGIAGLDPSVSPDLSHIIFSESGVGGIRLRLWKSKGGSVSDLTVATLPEKCVWGRRDPSTVYCAVPKEIPAAEYPDDWYRGRLFFDDELWKIHAESGTAEMLADLGTEGSAIDAISLAIDPDDTALTFINKRDLTLWLVNLK